jgi:hypothetical protein
MDTWDKFWMVVLASVIGSALYVLVNLCVSEKRTLRYEMGGGDGFGGISIVKVIDNAPDESIRLSNGVSYPQAVQLLDSLNSNLKRYPYDYGKK